MYYNIVSQINTKKDFDQIEKLSYIEPIFKTKINKPQPKPQHDYHR